jgi:hypothetical protein
MAIPFTVIKGPALHESVYTDSGIRSHADIDVLVPSRTDALRLIRALGLVEATDRYNSRLRKRLIQSGRVHTNCMGWPVEFMYPIRWPCDPMFSLLERHCDQLLKIPASESMLSVPPPELHLLLLIAHTAIHMCSRWIWYLDLAMLLSRHRERIDLPWIEKELDRLQLLNISAGISQFCRRYIDSRFPILRSGAPGWNTPLQQVMVSHQQVQGLISVYHSGGWRRYFTGFLSPTRYFLITDPLPTFSHGPSAARTWLVNRVFYTLRLESSGLHQLLDRLLMYLGGILPMVFRWYRKRHAPIVAHRVDDAVDIRPPASSGGRN